jgi:hypothetical protein
VTAQAPALRRVRVEPLSARAELGYVVRVGLVIVVAASMYLRVDSALFNDDGVNHQLLPFQQLVLTRPDTEQRMFRELQEGLLEAEARRSSTGEWPTVSELADEGIPPFAFDPTVRDRYTWHLFHDGVVVNYLGIPERSGAPAWLLLILEPAPDAPPYATVEDEEHHRLMTGEMLQVSTWVHADGQVAQRSIPVPQTEGWIELFAVGPSLARPPLSQPNPSS